MAFLRRPLASSDAPIDSGKILPHEAAALQELENEEEDVDERDDHLRAAEDWLKAR